MQRLVVFGLMPDRGSLFPVYVIRLIRKMCFMGVVVWFLRMIDLVFSELCVDVVLIYMLAKALYLFVKIHFSILWLFCFMFVSCVFMCSTVMQDQYKCQ